MAENGSKRKAVEIETHVNIVTTFVSEKKNFQWNIKHFDVIWHMMMKDRASEVEKQLTFKFASGEKIGNPTEWSISLSKDVNDDLKVSLALLDSASFSEEGQNEVYASLITWITTKPEYRGDEDDETKYPIRTFHKGGGTSNVSEFDLELTYPPNHYLDGTLTLTINLEFTQYGSGMVQTTVEDKEMKAPTEIDGNDKTDE